MPVERDGRLSTSAQPVQSIQGVNENGYFKDMAAQTPTDGYYRLQATVPVAITVPARARGRWRLAACMTVAGNA